MKTDSLVLIPTYNEKENIEKIIRKVFSLATPFHVLIIDDGSPDGTADIVKNLQKEFPENLFIEERKGKLGLGTAYIHGFNWALKHAYDFIFEMDADFSHNPKDLPKLIGASNSVPFHLHLYKSDSPKPPGIFEAKYKSPITSITPCPHE